MVHPVVKAKWRKKGRIKRKALAINCHFLDRDKKKAKYINEWLGRKGRRQNRSIAFRQKVSLDISDFRIGNSPLAAAAILCGQPHHHSLRFPTGKKETLKNSFPRGSRWKRRVEAGFFFLFSRSDLGFHDPIKMGDRVLRAEGKKGKSFKLKRKHL